MTVPVPENPKIYHIVHIDRLESIIADGCLWCDAEMAQRALPGTIIGMDEIKQRRRRLPLSSHDGLYVGDCVPFYFCPRSVMLYLLYMRNHIALSYRGGQEPIVHLETDLYETAAWAEQQGKRWAFTLSNAGSYTFEDYCDLKKLDEIKWNAIEARDWQECRQWKQAEFLVEGSFPWTLVQRIGVHSKEVCQQAIEAMRSCTHKPCAEVKGDWYY